MSSYSYQQKKFDEDHPILDTFEFWGGYVYSHVMPYDDILALQFNGISNQSFIFHLTPNEMLEYGEWLIKHAKEHGAHIKSCSTNR